MTMRLDLRLRALHALFAMATFCCAAVPCAAPFTVDSTVDSQDASPGDGTCDDGSARCTLRAAIEEANSLPGADTIDFGIAPGSVIDLDDDTLGELSITSDLSIQGPTGTLSGIIVQADAASGTAASRVFSVATGCTASISNLEIRNGRVQGIDAVLNGTDGGDIAGGGILSQGTLSLVQCLVAGNQAIAGDTINSTAGRGQGGGVAVTAGTTTITDSTISGNLARGGDGLPLLGGISGGFGIGGGTFVLCGFGSGGTLNVLRSTISGNTAEGGGGDNGGFGIGGGCGLTPGFAVTGLLSVLNSTISGNTAAGGTGGVAVGAGRAGGVHATSTGGPLNVLVQYSTIAGNAATGDTNTHGGGIYSLIGIGQAGQGSRFKGCIVANNTSAGDGQDLFNQVASSGFNLIEDVAFGAVESNGTGADGRTNDGTGDQTGVDPNLGPLQNNGGLNQTIALVDPSPAFNAITPNGAPLDVDGATVTTDQLGTTRPAIFRADIGAFESLVIVPVEVSEFELD